MQGVKYAMPSTGTSRFLTKKALKDQAKAHPGTIILEATSMFGGEYEGYAADMPEGMPASVVGPDPYTNRKWYATIVREGDRLKVS